MMVAAKRTTLVRYGMTSFEWHVCNIPFESMKAAILIMRKKCKRITLRG